MLLEIGAEHLVDDALHRALDFGIAELGLCLTLELRLVDLDRQDGRQSFANVVPAERKVVLFQRLALAGVRVDGARQRRLEAGEVRPALMRVDVVDE